MLISVCAGQTADTASDAIRIQAQKPGDNRQDQAYYDKRKKGWYWYETEPKEEEAKTAMGYSYEELWNMYPDDFQALLKQTMKIAVQYPTEKNVLTYLGMQDIARRKSMAFASVVGYVGQAHPGLSNADVHPVIRPGRTALAETKQDEVAKTITESSGDFALVMFIQKECRFCDVQKSILKFFTARYGWNIRYIDIDMYPDIASRFGIEQTPSLVLISKESKDYIPVSVGVVSLRDLNNRIYRSIRLFSGKIRPEQWYLYDFEKNAGSDPLKFISMDEKK
jgi:conjugal transfer pilus assembly protein TraF